MKVTVKIERKKAGYMRSREILVDGYTYNEESYTLSQKLTNTTKEDTQGIFGASDKFYRKKAWVEVEFGFDFKLCDYNDAFEFTAELKRRVDLVTAAFETKYPVSSSVSDVDILYETPVPVTSKQLAFSEDKV